MKAKKVLALVMVLALVLGLAACGGSAASSSEAAPASSSEAAPASSSQAAPASSSEAAPASSSEAAPATEEQKVITIGIPQSSKVDDYDNNRLTEYFEDLTGYDIQFKFYSGGTEGLQQLAAEIGANEKLPDILMGWRFSQATLYEYGEDGYFANIGPYLTDPNVMPEYNKHFKLLNENTQLRASQLLPDPSNGEIYCAPMISGLWVWDDLQTMTFINKTWLEKLGLDFPKTIAEMEEVLRAFVTQDPNGNGKADEVGMLGLYNDGTGYDITMHIVNAYIYYNTKYMLNADNGQLYSPVITDEYREALKELNKLTSEGLIADLTYTAPESSELKGIYSPEDGVSIVGIGTGHTEVVMTNGNPTIYEYWPLAAFEDETGKGGYTVIQPQGIYFDTAVTTDCEDIEGACRFLDYFYMDDSVASIRHGQKGVDWDWLDPNLDPEKDKDTDNVNVMGDAQSFFGGVRTWCRNVNVIWTNYNYLQANQPEDPWLAYSRSMRMATEDNMRAGKQPQEIVTDIVYNGEERERINEIETLLKEYIRQARAEFATGQMDPNSDADWNKYLSELESLGLTEYVTLSQAAYDRMK